MIAIFFCTTPKSDLPKQFFISRNTEPLGAELNDEVCSRLGNMLYLEIQEGKEATKTSDFQQ